LVPKLKSFTEEADRARQMSNILEEIEKWWLNVNQVLREKMEMTLFLTL
jgi:hypothetical protein